MSRDWTPRESYLVEQQNIAEGRGNKWDFMSNLVYIPLGQEPQRAVSDEEIAIRKEFPTIGKFLDCFMDLYKKISVFEGGLTFLREKDAELAAYIETGKGDPENYLIKWFEGELDERFYYSERNNELLVSEICKEAIARGLKNWIITDPDCVQVRRQVGFEDCGVYQLMQLQECDLAAEGKGYQLMSAQIDLGDFDSKEIQNVLHSYGYESITQLSKLLGDRREAYGQLAEMIFETYSLEFVTKLFSSWNEALGEVAKLTGLNLDEYKEETKMHVKDGSEKMAGKAYACNGVPIFDACGGVMNVEDAERLEASWERSENYAMGKDAPQEQNALDDQIREAEAERGNSARDSGARDTDKER